MTLFCAFGGYSSRLRLARKLLLNISAVGGCTWAAELSDGTHVVGVASDVVEALDAIDRLTVAPHGGA
jgi:hypothetical protein